MWRLRCLAVRAAQLLSRCRSSLPESFGQDTSEKVDHPTTRVDSPHGLSDTILGLDSTLLETSSISGRDSNLHAVTAIAGELSPLLLP